MPEHKLYICHYCATYKTFHRGDIIRHFTRQHSCKCNTLISYNDAKILSPEKVFIFDFDYTTLLLSDMIYIINNYVEKINYIHKKFVKEISLNGISTNNIITNNNNSLLNLTESNNNQFIQLSEYTNNSNDKKDILENIPFLYIKDHPIFSMLSKNIKNLPAQNETMSHPDININQYSDILALLPLKYENVNGNNKKEDVSINIESESQNSSLSSPSQTGETNNIEKNETTKKTVKKRNEQKMIEFDELYFNKEKNLYVCDKCYSEYTRKYNLTKHMDNSKSCEYQQKINNLMENSKKIALLKKEKEMKEKENILQHITQNIGNVNIQNIHNNNNTQNNMYNVSLKDFIHDNYDITHIKDSFYQTKGFFIYHNLLRVIMENKNNHNVFFVDGEAIIYTDNEINKMSSDKAGYLILDKLSKSVDQLIYRQSEESQKYYEYISKYYHVVKGHFKHDTIFKDYDVDEKKFIYTSQSSLFRSRDKYLSKIISTTNKFSNEIREHMNLDSFDIKNIPLVNPNIEYYASVRMRYKDLKDKD